jgi:hypothetical protein
MVFILFSKLPCGVNKKKETLVLFPAGKQDLRLGNQAGIIIHQNQVDKVIGGMYSTNERKSVNVQPGF